MEGTLPKAEHANIGSLQREADAALPRFIGIRQVELFAGLSKASILRRIARGEFPRPAYREGGNLVRWDYDDLIRWRESKLGERDRQNTKEVIAA